MYKTNDFNKSCICCRHSFCENIWGDTICNLTDEVCRVDIDKDVYTTCDDFEEG